MKNKTSQKCHKAIKKDEEKASCGNKKRPADKKKLFLNGFNIRQLKLKLYSALESTNIDKEVLMNQDWSLEYVKECISNGKWDQLLSFIKCYATRIYEASSGIFTSDQENLFKLLWLLIGTLNKTADKKSIHKIGIIYNIAISSLIYCSCKEKDKHIHEKILKTLFHIVKQFYKILYIEGVISMISSIHHEYGLCMQYKFVIDDVNDLLLKSYQMSYSIYTKSLSDFINFKHSDLTSLFMLRVNSLALLSNFDWTENNFIESVYDFIKRWKVLLQKHIYNSDVVLSGFHELFQCFGKYGFKQVENMFWKLLCLYTSISIKSGTKLSFDGLENYWIEAQFSEQVSLMKIVSTVVSNHKAIHKHYSESKEEDLEMMSAIINSHKTFMLEHLIDLYQILKSNILESKCLKFVVTLQQLFASCLETLFQQKAVKLVLCNASSCKELMYLFSWNLQLFMKCKKEKDKNLALCTCLREATEVDLKKFIGILREFCQLSLVQNNLTPDDLKCQKSFLYGVAVYYFNEKKYRIAKDVLEVVVLLMEISITKDAIAVDIHFVEELAAKYNVYIRCLLKLKQLQECLDAITNLLKIISTHSSKHDDFLNEDVVLLLQGQVCQWWKIECQQRETRSATGKSFLFETLRESVDIASGSFIRIVMSLEYEAVKKYKNHFKVSKEFKQLTECLIKEYEEEGDLMKYAHLLVELSTVSGKDYKKRLHWCHEAISVLEEMLNEVYGNDDKMEYHIHDILAYAYLQVCVVQYEEKVSKCCQVVGKSISDLVQEVSDIGSVDIPSDQEDSYEEYNYLDQNYISSLNTSLEHWTEVVYQANRQGDSSVFYDASSSAKSLFEAGVVYSLMSQHFNAIKASYFSAFIYSLLLEKEESKHFEECFLNSLIFATSQSMLLEDKEFADKLVSYLQNVRVNSPHHAMQIRLLNARHQLHLGEVEACKEILRSCLGEEITNIQTKTGYLLKSEIYFLCSLIRLIPGTCDSNVISVNGSDFPKKSPFPPIDVCLKCLRSLYQSYINKSEKDINGDLSFSSSWAVLDRLLTCLCRNAEMLSEQGSVLEAKSLLKEALLLSRKFHLPFWVLEILQKLSYIDLLLRDKNSFMRNFSTITTILNTSVNECIDEDNIYAPKFINHAIDCNCSYCANPKLQQIHICLFMQYIESRNFFQRGSIDKENSIGCVKAVIENARERFQCNEASIKEMIQTLPIETENNTAIFNNNLTSHSKNHKLKLVRSNTFTKSKSNKSRKLQESELNLSIFSKYKTEIETKIIEPFEKNNTRVISTIEQLIFKIEQSVLLKEVNHEFRRLVAQLHWLKGLLCAAPELWKNWITSYSLKPDLENEDNQSQFKDKDLVSSKVSRTIENTKPKRKVQRKSKKTKETPQYDHEICEESAVISKRGSKKTAKSRKNKVVNDVTSKIDTLELRDNIGKSVDHGQVTSDLRKALHVTNPYIDALIIKSIYQLITLLSGYHDKNLSVASQFLQSTRTLHQQFLASSAKKLKKENDQQIFKVASVIEKFSVPDSLFSQTDELQGVVDEHVPQDWRLCSLALQEVNKRKFVILSRMQNKQSPCIVKFRIDSDAEESSDEDYEENIVRDLAAAFEVNLYEKFTGILNDSKESMSISNKKEWWQERVKLDTEMNSVITRLEEEWLRGWRGVLFGELECEEQKSTLNDIAVEIKERIDSDCNVNTDLTLLTALISSHALISESQLRTCFREMFGEVNADNCFEVFLNLMKKSDIKKRLNLSNGKSIDQLRRSPVILILDKNLQALPWESIPSLREHPVTRMPSLLMTVTHCMQYKDIISSHLQVRNAFYVLNPRNDLKRTEEKFADWFEREGWQGIVRRAPTQAEYKNALVGSDLFIYCGHGSGQEYLKWDAVQRLYCSAVALLMGCSSGKLTVNGELEAQGMVNYYLIAGSPAVVANLWDVTDKDIDLFLEELLHTWLKSANKKDLASCVAISRDVCKLPYLIGAAPVVYGLPLFIR